MSLCSVFDLHCDTVTACRKEKTSLIENSKNVDITRGLILDKWIQTFAFWIDDSFNGSDAFDEFMGQYDFLQAEIKNHTDKICHYNGAFQNGKCNVIMSVEGGRVLGGDLEKIATLKKLGISYLTLVWNGDNEIGSGIKGSDGGLTDFGKETITELERNNIIIDVSHLNKKGFDDVIKIATKPIIATHSNAFSICDNLRNLDDNQIKYLVENNGLCGVNFYPLFINHGENCTLDEVKAHIDHILALDGKDIIALGSDFDGAPMPTELNNISKLAGFYDVVSGWYSKEIADKMFFENAKKFVDNNINFNII